MPPRHLALVRFSALGDIAMTVPVIDTLARRFPDLKITVVSRPYVAPLFESLPANVAFLGADLRGRHHGVRGMWRLAAELRHQGVDALADLHGVLRTAILRTALRLRGVRVAVIDKGRRDRRRFVRHTVACLPTSFERYSRVLDALGVGVEPDFVRLTPGHADTVTALVGHKGSEAWVGVAPFAAHVGKTYPLPLLTQALEQVSAGRRVRLFVFGTAAEMDTLRADWQQRFADIVFVPDVLRGLGQELQLMSRLDVMLTMDSGNMHLASLVGLTAVSVWGQTHPDAGFLGWRQRRENAVMQDMDCRPCSIFGNKPCRLGGYPCMARLQPGLVAARVRAAIGEK